MLSQACNSTALIEAIVINATASIDVIRQLANCFDQLLDALRARVDKLAKSSPQSSLESLSSAIGEIHLSIAKHSS